MDDEIETPLFLCAALVLGCAVLFLAMVFAFRPNGHEEFSQPLAIGPGQETKVLREELLRCDALGPKDADDRHCNAVWAENRRRFFNHPTHAATVSTSMLPAFSQTQTSNAPSPAEPAILASPIEHAPLDDTSKGGAQ